MKQISCPECDYIEVGADLHVRYHGYGYCGHRYGKWFVYYCIADTIHPNNKRYAFVYHSADVGDNKGRLSLSVRATPVAELPFIKLNENRIDKLVILQ